MRYSASARQPIGGRLPSMWEVGPSDLRYTSSTSPTFRAQVDRLYGRKLAGTDTDVQDESVDPGWAKNELDYFAQMDDTQGNGVFDPPGTHGNLHADAGIFSARLGIPGYLARERSHAPSEVIDVTTGRPTVYVNGGSVAMDDAARVAFIENNQYETPLPVLDAYKESNMRSRSIANVRQNPGRVTPAATSGLGTSEPMSGAKLFAITAVVGLAVGVAYAAFIKK